VRLAALALFLTVGAFAQDDPWAFVHPQATFIGGVSWQSVKNSEFARILSQDLKGKGSISGEIDFIDRLDFALISVPELTPGASKSMLIVFRGKFDLVKLHATAAKEGAKSQTYNDVELLSPSKDDSAVVAIIDPTTLLIGDRQSVTLGIRNRFHQVNDSELMKRALATSEKASIWMVFDAPPSMGSSSPMLQGLSRMGLAVNLHRNADLVVDLDAQDAQHAGAFAAAAQMMLNTQSVKMAALKVATSGNSVRLSTTITPEQVRAQMQQVGQNVAKSFDLGGFGGLLAAKGAGPNAATPAPVEEAPLPPEKNVVKIYGLDDGVREVPLSPKQ
jgi:hypothetical protein